MSLIIKREGKASNLRNVGIVEVLLSVGQGNGKEEIYVKNKDCRNRKVKGMVAAEVKAEISRLKRNPETKG